MYRILCHSALLIATLAAAPFTHGQLVTNVVNINVNATTNRILDAVNPNPNPPPAVLTTTNFYTFTVSGLDTSIVDLDFRLSVLHSAVGDLDVVLISPVGLSLAMTNVSAVGGVANNFQDTYFDDQGGAGRIGQPGFDTAPFAGPEYGGVRYKPQFTFDTLAKFNGSDPNGIWTLRVEDSIDGDDGFVLSAGANPSVLDDLVNDSISQIGTSWGTNAIGTQLIFTTAVPEPASITLTLLGAVGLMLASRRFLRR
jgi:subtilisin-like proprotein convertase family protein